MLTRNINPYAFYSISNILAALLIALHKEGFTAFTRARETHLQRTV